MKVNEAIVDHAVQSYGTAKSQLKPLPGGHYSDVYQFSKNNRTYVLRIGPIEISVNAAKGMIEWISFLYTHGAAVSKPVLSVNNELMEFMEQDDNWYSIVVFEKAKGILAETLSKEEWNNKLCQSIGRTVGKMHSVSKKYTPSRNSIRRPEWNMTGNCYNAEDLNSSHTTVKEKNQKILNYVQTLPKEKDCYGLIHADLHFANFYVDVDTNQVTIFDFDDCSYGWYAMDIAMALFDVAVLCDGPDKEEFATGFMKNYLSGYLPENHIDVFWISQLPYFLKLLEIGVYSQICKNCDVNDYHSWCGRFMSDRKYRIENDVPYISVDFESILEEA